MLAGYIEICASLDVPIIEDAWQTICSNECKNALNESDIELKNAIDCIRLPFENESELVTVL